MKAVLRILVLAGCGVGGTEKAAVSFAVGLKKRGHNVDFWGPAGPRAKGLLENGVNFLGHLSETELEKFLQLSKPDIVHQHVPGTPISWNPLYKIWPRLPPPRPILLETNVFGQLQDGESRKYVDYRFFVSMASGTQAFSRSKIHLDSKSLNTHSVLYNPVEFHSPLGKSQRANLRRKLGMAPGQILAIRLGRPGGKWREWECEAFQQAKQKQDNLRLMLMEPPKEIVRRVQRGVFGAGIIIKSFTSDLTTLHNLYAVADLMIHASDSGESFGYTLGEAMAASLPIIVRTTPWGDNAQIELVKNGVSGYVCASIPEMARRFVDLAQDESTRRKMGAAGKRWVIEFANLKKELDLLEEVFFKFLDGKAGLKIKKRNRLWSAFSRNFSVSEWQTSETFISHPKDRLFAKFYASFRIFQTYIREKRSMLSFFARKRIDD